MTPLAQFTIAAVVAFAFSYAVYLLLTGEMTRDE